MKQNRQSRNYKYREYMRMYPSKNTYLLYLLA